jgi:hypothetical protein
MAAGKQFKLVTLKLDSIRTDGGTQPRAKIDQSLIGEYAEAMDAGAKFPPLSVYFDGTDNWLADGFHRYHAARMVRALDFQVELYKGTKRDAILHSVAANVAHGQRRSPDDERHAVLTLLKDKQWGKWSDHEIARQCAVLEHSMVARLRASLSQKESEKSKKARTYKTKHGTVAKMNVSRIGKGRKRPGIATTPEEKQDTADYARLSLICGAAAAGGLFSNKGQIKQSTYVIHDEALFNRFWPKESYENFMRDLRELAKGLPVALKGRKK